MKQFFIIALCILSISAYAEIKMEISPSKISADDSFQITLSQESPKDNGASPNLSVLQQDFTVLGTQQSNMYSSINGQITSSRTWIISLSPKKTGTLTIPAIQIGTEETKPLNIHVGAKAIENQTDTTTLPQNKEVFLKTEVSKNNPIVNQQIIYTVKLFNSKRLLDVDYQGPQVSDALIFPLGNGKRYQILQNNTDYTVEEQSYAIFPQKSGPLKITSPKLTALVYDYDLHKVKTQDQAIELTVAPIPKSYKGEEWLPAKQISLSEEYENSTPILSQGSTLIRHVTFQGVGVPAQLLPQLHFSETENLSVYPEKVKERNQIKQGELVGSTNFKVTYLFKKAGKLMIPAIEIPWFNTDTGKEEVAILPPRSIEIKSSLIAAAAKPSSQTKISKNPVEAAPALAAPIPVQTGLNRYWPILAFIFALAWLFTLLAWLWSRKSKRTKKGKENKWMRQLSQACKENNPLKARDALLQWATYHWPDAIILNVNDLNQYTQDAPLKKQLHLLSQALYAQEKKASWHGLDLLQSIQALKRNDFTKDKSNTDLPPINPS